MKDDGTMDELGGRIATFPPAKRALLERRLQAHRAVAPIPGIARQTGTGPAPLSFAQQRLWFLDQLQPGSSAYNVPRAVLVTGALNVAALQQSLGEIVRRHEALRTVFATVEHGPVQVIRPPTVFVLSRIDLSEVPADRRESEAQTLAKEEAKRPFDLSKGPLFRATLLRLVAHQHVLLLTMHHVVSDGWSMRVLIRELGTLYECFSMGRPSPLPALPIQYADFAVWQQRRPGGKGFEDQVSYWKKQLSGISALELPTDHQRPAVQTFNGARHAFQVPQPLTHALHSLSREQGVTLFMSLVAAFQALLHRYTGQHDIVVGTPIANRDRVEIEGLIGFFANTLVLRTDTSGDPSFRELLARVREMTLDAFTHRELPFEKLVEELQPQRDLSRIPLFQVMIALQDSQGFSLELPGLKMSPFRVSSEAVRFDLEFHLRENPQGLLGVFAYNTDLFEAATIARMGEHFQGMLKGIVADPRQRLSKLPLLTDSERHKLLVEWNATQAEYPKDRCIHELFEAQVGRSPEATAVVFRDQRLTYGELNARANRLAQVLRTHGVRPNSLVGICVERSLEMAVAVLGILKAGAAYVPLDPTYPSERLAFMIEDSRAVVLLTEERLLARLPKHRAEVICLDSRNDALARANGENLAKVGGADDLAYVLYTSGSTGTPKGVDMSHRPLVNLISWQLRNSALAVGTRTLQFAPLGFDVSFQEMFSTWCSGGTLVLISEELRRDPVALLRCLAAESIERLFVPFVALRQLAEVAEDRDLVPTSLREVIAAGEQLQISRPIANLFARLGNCRLQNQYGPTETHVVTAFTLSGAPEKWPALPSIGRPIANTQIYLLDGNLQPVPVGVTGELYVGGECLARGYRDRPELTAERFIPNPFSATPGARLYKTGDLARYRHDGNIQFLGRSDHQVKVRGYRIELGEIETVLRQHPSVRDAAVIARDDNLLVAYAVGAPPAAPATGELREFLRQKLPDYMMPSAFVFLETLPLTPNGKIDRRALPEPSPSSAVSEATFVAPRTPLEQSLAQIWCSLLKLDRVSVHDNFFDLGGHSLLATQLVSRLRQAFQIELPLRAIFEKPTIESLVLALMEQQAQSAAPEDIEKLLTQIESLPDESAPKAIV